jgi:hypothetical protein
VLQKRKEAAKGEMDKLKAAKEMQKKMGKALLRNMSEAREREEKAQKEIILQAQKTEEQKRPLQPKKSVTFAKLPGESGSVDIRDHSEKPANLDWGDIDPARLRTSDRPTLMMKTQMERQPMKMVVVERMPSGAESEGSAMEEQDSDDESTQGDTIHSDLEDCDWNRGGADADTDEDVDEEAVLEDEVNLDFARHQREIALDYHNKRCTIGKATSNSMVSHSYNEAEEDWNHPVRHKLLNLFPFIHSPIASLLRLSRWKRPSLRHIPNLLSHISKQVASHRRTALLPLLHHLHCFPHLALGLCNVHSEWVN